MGSGQASSASKSCAQRVPDEAIKELIIATNPTIEGDTTAMYLARELKPARRHGHPARQRTSGRRRTWTTQTKSRWAEH